MTPTLSTLGELRRYAHTLGVLYLFSQWRRHSGSTYTNKELDALEVAIILHDIATPPFGHLFEYLLKEELGWDHESAAVDTLLQQHVQEDAGHQIFAGKTPRVMKIASRLGVDIDLVLEILRKQHPLHHLIFGSLDFDNIDNVWRMAWALGFKLRPADAVDLAKSLSVDKSGTLTVSERDLKLVDVWGELRRRVYEVLVFDSPTVASQSVLTEALRVAMRSHLVTTEDWTLTDEMLLDRLMKQKDTRKMISDEYLGVLPKSLLTLQFAWKETEVFSRSRLEIQALIEKKLNEVGNAKWHVYVFKERGSFGKRLQLRTEAGEVHNFGTLSRSLIVYIFYSGSAPKGMTKEAPKLIESIARVLATTSESIVKVYMDGKNIPDESLF
ncbi:HD domain-containing protein [Ralstonia wenshanensis]|nr:HD domain-containing protein [Ralstonia wenshanensis]